MVAYSAVSYSAKGAAKPALGTIKLEADTSVALDERLVNFSHLKLTETHFPDLPNDQLREVIATLTEDVRPGAMMIALDRVLARLDKSQIIPKNVDGVKADPPVIFYSTSPAILVNLDGDPIWSPIKDNDLKFAVNTNWDLFEHVPTKTFFLRHNQSWLSAADIKGPWKPAGKLPDSFTKLPADDNWKDVKAALPGRALPSRAQGVRQHDARGADSAAGRAELSAGDRHAPALGLQHRKRRLQARQDRRGVLPGLGPLVHGGRFRRAVDVRHAHPAGRFQEDPALAPAIARARLGAGHRRGGRSRPAGPDPADGARRQEAGEGARRAVPGRTRSSSRSRRRPSRGP